MKRQHLISFIFLILVFPVLLTGCGKKQSAKNVRDAYIAVEDDYAVPYASNSIADSGSMSFSKAASFTNSGFAAEGAYMDDAVAAPQQRMIKKSANINIQVTDPIAAAANISSLTEEMGGFVVSSSSTQEYYNSEISLPKANLSIRVPAERLNEMIDFIENQTSDASKYVSNKRIYGTDITSDYVDTRSRLTSLEKTRDKLYEIMDTAVNAEEALEIYNRISDVETDIEVYKGQIKYMEESVSLSSVEIQISSIRPAPIHTVQSWSIGEVFSDAIESLLDACKDMVEFLIHFVIVTLPVLIMIAAPIALIGFLIWKFVLKKKIRKTKKAAETVEKTENSEKQE